MDDIEETLRRQGITLLRVINDNGTYGPFFDNNQVLSAFHNFFLLRLDMTSLTKSNCEMPDVLIQPYSKRKSNDHVASWRLFDVVIMKDVHADICKNCVSII